MRRERGVNKPWIHANIICTLYTPPSALVFAGFTRSAWKFDQLSNTQYCTCWLLEPSKTVKICILELLACDCACCVGGNCLTTWPTFHHLMLCNFYATTLKNAREPKMQKCSFWCASHTIVRAARAGSFENFINCQLLLIVTFMLQPSKMQGEARNHQKRCLGTLCPHKTGLKIWPTVHCLLLHKVTFMLQPSKMRGEARNYKKRHFGALRAQLCKLRAQDRFENLTNCPLLIATVF